MAAKAEPAKPDARDNENTGYARVHPAWLDGPREYRSRYYVRADGSVILREGSS